MNIRPFEPSDHQTLSSWWTLHQWPTMPLNLLPKNGLVVENEGARICAGFIYNSDSDIAWLEYVVASPLCDKLIRDRALDVLIPGLLNRAKELGKSVVFTSVNHPKLEDRYQRHGAILADKSVTHLVWRL